MAHVRTISRKLTKVHPPDNDDAHGPGPIPVSLTAIIPTSPADGVSR